MNPAEKCEKLVTQMDPYKAMYLKMFNAATDTEHRLLEAVERLRAVQQECEELFLAAPESTVLSLYENDENLPE